MKPELVYASLACYLTFSFIVGVRFLPTMRRISDGRDWFTKRLPGHVRERAKRNAQAYVDMLDDLSPLSVVAAVTLIWPWLLVRSR